MRPRFVGRLGLADLLTVTNAALGFVAVVAVTVDPLLAARIVLLGAIFDALDGIVARLRGGTSIGTHLDSLADVATFGVAPAFLVFVDGRNAAFLGMGGVGELVFVAVPAVFVATAVTRLALYTELDVDDDRTEGVQSTLAATLLAAGLLVGLGPDVLLVGTGILALGMLAPRSYPDLRVRDALVMGVIQALTVGFPQVFDRVFPTALFIWAVGYLVLSPWLYRRDEGKRS